LLLLAALFFATTTSRPSTVPATQATPTPVPPLTFPPPAVLPTAEVAPLILFGLVALGVFANWFWGFGWEYVRNPDKPLSSHRWSVVAVRFVLSLIAALLTFIPTYSRLDQAAQDSLIGFLVAFQTGFFWQAALDAIVKEQPRLPQVAPPA
jgi:hypothetical protein